MREISWPWLMEAPTSGAIAVSTPSLSARMWARSKRRRASSTSRFEDIHFQLQGFQLGLSGFDEVAAVFFELLQFNFGALFLQVRLAQLFLGDCAKTL